MVGLSSQYLDFIGNKTFTFCGTLLGISEMKIERAAIKIL
jgi:hypothetical protein